MSTAETLEKFRIVLNQLLEISSDIIGIIISNVDGSIIYTCDAQNKPISGDSPASPSLSQDTVVSITQIAEPVLVEIRQKYSSNRFSTALFETEYGRIVNVSVGDYIYTYILDLMASTDSLYPYLYLVTEKIHRLLENYESVQLSIPRLGNFVGGVFDPLSPEEEKYFALKYILIGESSVGKTSIVNRFITGRFEEDFRPTIGLNVMSHDYAFLGYNFSMIIYDIGSQKFFRRVRRTYYRGANVALLVFDLTKRASFEALKKWKKEMEQFIDRDIPFCIVGNKSDLPREISFEEGSALATEMGGSYIETSALESKNIEDAFGLLAYKCVSRTED